MERKPFVCVIVATDALRPFAPIVGEFTCTRRQYLDWPEDQIDRWLEQNSVDNGVFGFAPKTPNQDDNEFVVEKLTDGLRAKYEKSRQRNAWLSVDTTKS